MSGEVTKDVAILLWSYFICNKHEVHCHCISNNLAYINLNKTALAKPAMASNYGFRDYIFTVFMCEWPKEFA